MLNFEFGTMASGKTENLIEDYISLVSEGKHALVWNSALDSRHEGFVSSRNKNLYDIQASLYKSTTNLFNKFFIELAKRNWQISNFKNFGEHTFLFVDEAQFLTSQQVDQLSILADFEDVTVNCHGLRTDFNGHLFEGSKRLFEVADNSFETETYCRRCKTGSAIFNARFYNEKLYNGEDKQIMIDDDDKVDYVPLCRMCYRTIKENYNENDNN